MNGIDLREASHDEAINVLRQTPQRVRLVVFRDEAQYKEEELWDSFTLELLRRPGQGLGLSIVGRRWAQARSAAGGEGGGVCRWGSGASVTRSLFSLYVDLGIRGNSAGLGRRENR